MSAELTIRNLRRKNKELEAKNRQLLAMLAKLEQLNRSQTARLKEAEDYIGNTLNCRKCRNNSCDKENSHAD